MNLPTLLYVLTHCQTKPRWSLTQILKLVNWLKELNKVEKLNALGPLCHWKCSIIWSLSVQFFCFQCHRQTSRGILISMCRWSVISTILRSDQNIMIFFRVDGFDNVDGFFTMKKVMMVMALKATTTMTTSRFFLKPGRMVRITMIMMMPLWIYWYLW